MIDEKTVLAVSKVFATKLKPFGYDTIQVDDGVPISEGRPTRLLAQDELKVPVSAWTGLRPGSRRSASLRGIWMGTHITDDSIAKAHPDWFVRNLVLLHPRGFNYPQVISTSRHIIQGGPDLLDAKWDEKSRTLMGRSLVVAHDPYVVTVSLGGAKVLSSSHPAASGDETADLSFTPTGSGVVRWWIRFSEPAHKAAEHR